MALKETYQDFLTFGEKLKIQNGGWKEEGGKLRVWGTANYQLDKDELWDKLKSYPNAEKEVAADIKVANKDIYGVYTVQSGDSLSKLAKKFLGNANRYMDIFNLNKDQLTNPDLIKVGQQLKIPNK
jgi:LysM repeat protein